MSRPYGNRDLTLTQDTTNREALNKANRYKLTHKDKGRRIPEYTNKIYPVELDTVFNNWTPENTENQIGESLYIDYMTHDEQDNWKNKCLKNKEKIEEYQILHIEKQIWTDQNALYYKIFLYNKVDCFYRFVTVTTDKNIRCKYSISKYNDEWLVARGDDSHYNFWHTCKIIFGIHRK